MMHVQQDQFTTGLEQATRVDRKPDDPRFPTPISRLNIVIIKTRHQGVILKEMCTLKLKTIMKKKPANQKSLMGSKAREVCSKIPVYQNIRAQYNDIKSKSTNGRSNTTAEKTNKNSSKPTKSLNHGRNRDVS